MADDSLSKVPIALIDWCAQHAIIILALLFSAALMTYAEVWQKNAEIANTTLTMGFANSMGIIMTYVFKNKVVKSGDDKTNADS